MGFTGVADFADLAKDDITWFQSGSRICPSWQICSGSIKDAGYLGTSGTQNCAGKDVRQVLAYVETEEVQVGAVYRTDAGISDKVEIVAAAPEGSHSPVIYPAAVVKDSPQPDEAKVLLDFLTGEEAKTVLEKYGFRMLN